MSEEVKAGLAQLSAAWDEAPEPENNFQDLPDGEYKVQVSSVDLGYTKSGENVMLTVETQIVEGPHVNRKIWKYIVFGSANINIAKADIKRLGYVLGALTELEQKKAQILNRRYIFKQASKANAEDPTKPYRNIYIQRALDGEGTQQAAPGTVGTHPLQQPPAGAPPDDLPF